MVVFYVRNSRIPDGKIVPITVALTQEVTKTTVASGFPTYADPEGEGIWLLTVSTREPDVNGAPIHPEFINILSEDTVHLEIEAAIGRICQKISWGTPLADNRAPQIHSMTPPITQVSNVSIFSDILVHLIDPLPAAGIDLSTVKMFINGHDVTADVQIMGNVFDLNLKYVPTRIL